MPKTAKPKNRTGKQKQFYSAQPWQCRHHKTHSELVAYVEASGAWEVIATINRTAGVCHEPMAQFICGLVNDSQKNQDLLLNAAETLEAILKDGLDYSTEQSAEHIVNAIKQS